jgi:hypothetical protein
MINRTLFIRSHSFHWHVQNETIPSRSQDHLPVFFVMYFLLPPFSTNYSSILPHFILPSISWSTSALFTATLLHQLFLHPPSLHLAIYFLVYLCTSTVTLLHQLFLHPPSLHLAIYFLVYLCTFSCHTSPPTILAPFLTSSCRLFLGLLLNLVFLKIKSLLQILSYIIPLFPIF